MIKVEGLTKNYGKFKAVDNLYLHIEKGEVFGFVGENGAGKSTTMKIAAGLLKPTKGTIFIDGYDVKSEVNKTKHSIGYMPDFFGVYDDLKMTEYMDFYCGVYGIKKTERGAIIDGLLELVNLEDKKGFYVDDLSRGMKQRLCLARALIHDPKVLILDEPASGLDPRARIEFREIIKTLRDMEKTIIISSHILLELSEICTTIGIIDKGRLVTKGTVDEIQKQLSHLSRIKLRATSDMDTIITVLKEQPNVADIVAANGYLEFSYGGSNEEKAYLLKSLINKDLNIFHFEETAESLESIFMQLTKGERN